MEVYGVLVSGGNVLLTDGTSGKRIQFNDKPIEPDGFVAVYSFTEFADFIGQYCRSRSEACFGAGSES